MKAQKMVGNAEQPDKDVAAHVGAERPIDVPGPKPLPPHTVLDAIQAKLEELRAASDQLVAVDVGAEQPIDLPPPKPLPSHTVLDAIQAKLEELRVLSDQLRDSLNKSESR